MVTRENRTTISISDHIRDELQDIINNQRKDIGWKMNSWDDLMFYYIKILKDGRDLCKPIKKIPD